MAAMAQAEGLGGAVGIRANGASSRIENLVLSGFDVFITQPCFQPRVS
jgi:putative N-acetylmannosamine-6-phosphate epimerase